MVRGGGGERDRRGDHGRRSGGWARAGVCGEVRQEEERDGQLEPDRGLSWGRVPSQAGWLPWLHQRQGLERHSQRAGLLVVRILTLFNSLFIYLFLLD